MFRMLDAARLTGATDMRRDAAAMAISSCSTAVTTRHRTQQTSVLAIMNQTVRCTKLALFMLIIIIIVNLGLSVLAPF